MLRGWWVRLRALMWPRAEDDAVRRELAEHLERETERNVAAGLSLDDARAAARRAVGNLTVAREAAREAFGWTWVDHLRQDLQYAGRGLLRDRVFSIFVMLSLALGIGVTAAVFSLADRLFLRQPEGVVDPGGLRRLYQRTNATIGGVLTIQAGMSYSRAKAVELSYGRRAEAADCVAPDTVPFSWPAGEMLIQGTYADASYFSLLGVRPALGRFFDATESRPGTAGDPLVAVLSYEFWQRQFGGDPTALGRMINVGHQAYRVIGVAPSEFTGPDLDATDVWMTLASFPGPTADGVPWTGALSIPGAIRVLLRPNAATADGWLSAVGTVTYRHAESANGKWGDTTATVLMGPLLESRGPSIQPQPGVAIAERLAGIALIVLLIACANVANLLLGRVGRRRREIAIRLALGIARWRLVRQLVTESVLLALAAGAAATAMAVWAGDLLRATLLPSVHWRGAVLDGRLVAFGLGVAALTGLAAGLVPAVQASPPDLTTALKAGEREGGSGAGSRRPQNGLIVVQIALSVVLLVGAGLFVRSLSAVRSIQLGYDMNDLVSGTVVWLNPAGHYADSWGDTRWPKLAAGLPAVAARLSREPDVAGVGLTASAPMEGFAMASIFLGDGQRAPRLADRDPARFSVSTGYLRATGLQLVRGRGIAPTDIASAPHIAVVNETMAHAYWPGRDPIGQCIRFSVPTWPCYIVVGIATNAHLEDVVEIPTAIVYIPLAQGPHGHWADPEWVVARARPGRAQALAGEMRRVLAQAFPDALPPWVTTRDTKVAAQYRPWEIGASLFGVLGLLALVVAAIGVYSVIAYSVTQRVHEMGVRVALGAQVRDILLLVVGEGAQVIGIGVVLGIGLALAMGHLVASMLYGVSPRDPAVLVLVAVVLAVIGLVASLVPALRAGRVDPMTALRAE